MTTPTSTYPDITPADYLAEVERVVRRHAYYARRIDWRTWEASNLDLVAEADEPADTYPAVRDLLGQLDGHSDVAAPDAAPGPPTGPDRLPDGQRPAVSVDDRGVGRLILPLARWDPEDPAGAQYVAAAWRGLGSPACGWVVDLRAGGGNAWTLLMALAPLLGPGPAVGFTYRDGTTETVTIDEQGTLTGGGRQPVRGPIDRADMVDTSAVPVAIVQSGETASAHEFAVMAFVGRPSTRSMGRPTAGVPTARDSFELADGSVLLLTVALGVDRLGTAHDSPLLPGEEIPGTYLHAPSLDRSDPALDAAGSWIDSQDTCVSG